MELRKGVDVLLRVWKYRIGHLWKQLTVSETPLKAELLSPKISAVMPDKPSQLSARSAVEAWLHSRSLENIRQLLYAVILLLISGSRSCSTKML